MDSDSKNQEPVSFEPMTIEERDEMLSTRVKQLLAIEERLVARWHLEKNIYEVAKRERFDDLLLITLAVMNRLENILGYRPEPHWEG